jgi:hypothetical protein
MPSRRTSDKLKMIKGTFQPCRAVKPVDPSLEPLPPAPRRLPPEVRKVWREIAKKAPHLRKPDQFLVEILAVLTHQFRTEPKMQTARIGIMSKVMSDLWMTPATRVNIPLPPEPNEYDEF